MPLLFGRAWKVNVDGLEVTGLRVQFRVEKDTKGDPNKMDLKVYNLAASSRARWTTAFEKGTGTVLLEAGYQSGTELLFYGNPRSLDHTKDGPDWVTHIQCGDGEAAFKVHCSFSVAPGASAMDVLKGIVSQMGLGTKDAIAAIQGMPLKMPSYPQGYAAHGPAARELEAWGRAQGIEWSIQDGVLKVVPPGKPLNETALVLSPSTGLIGSPDHGRPDRDGLKSYIRAACLLQPGLRPFRAVRLETANFSGFYRVEKVMHVGDSHGQEWNSTAELAAA